MRDIIRKVFCDMCGQVIADSQVDMGRYREWSISINRWAEGEGDSSPEYVSYDADLCDDCKEVIMKELGIAGLTLRYTVE